MRFQDASNQPYVPASSLRRREGPASCSVAMSHLPPIRPAARPDSDRPDKPCRGQRGHGIQSPWGGPRPAGAARALRARACRDQPGLPGQRSPSLFNGAPPCSTECFPVQRLLPIDAARADALIGTGALIPLEGPGPADTGRTGPPPDWAAPHRRSSALAEPALAAAPMVAATVDWLPK